MKTSNQFNRIYLVIFGIFTIFAVSAQAEWKEGDSVPDLSQFGLEGELPALEGKVTYIDFWASWCGPCKAAFPAIERLYQENKDKGFQVIAVNLDNSAAAMKRFTDRVKPSFALVRDGSQELAQLTGLEYMPTAYLIDREGKIRKIHTGWNGSKSEETLSKAIQGLL